MRPAGAYRFAVVCEAAADRRVATGLADRVFCREVDWIGPESLDLHRRWQGLEEPSSHLEWHAVPGIAKKLGVRAHGHFEGRPGAPDAHNARLALLLLATRGERPDAVVLIRDSDGDERRRRGLEQARIEARPEKPWPFFIVIGVAHPKREAWLLAGFEPQGEDEERRLDGVRSELGVDPRLWAKTLTARSEGAFREAKRVLALLTDSDPDREEICWADCALELLSERGHNTGLAAYLEEVEVRLIPLLRGWDSPPRP